MKILALDLGVHTGYALEADDYPLACGTWTLGVEKANRSLDYRIRVLWKTLQTLHKGFKIDRLVWEDVQFQSAGCAQTQLWASLRTVCWFMGIEHAIHLDCCPVQTLKKWATGSGGATKDDMARHLCQNPRFKLVECALKSGKNKGKPAPLQVLDTVTRSLLDNNAVDALHLLGWAKKTSTE